MYNAYCLLTRLFNKEGLPIQQQKIKENNAADVLFHYQSISFI